MPERKSCVPTLEHGNDKRVGHCRIEVPLRVTSTSTCSGGAAGRARGLLAIAIANNML